ncbi:hypothetical protein Hanom_Chr04g00364211 [Helianthus anomalus]
MDFVAGPEEPPPLVPVPVAFDNVFRDEVRFAKAPPPAPPLPKGPLLQMKPLSIPRPRFYLCDTLQRLRTCNSCCCRWCGGVKRREYV